MDSKFAFRAAALLLVGLVGCRDAEPRTDAKPQAVEKSSGQIVTLRVLVVNDPPLAEAIERLRGEWSERSGDTLNASAKPWDEIIAADAIDADVIVFPSRYLGELCTKNWLRAVRENVLDSETYDAADVFPLVARQLVRFDNQVMALPLGVELPVMCYRADYFDDAKRPVPKTWGDYAALIENQNMPKSYAQVTSIGEPVESWPAIVFLTRAALYAVHPDRVGILFDPEMMEPRITDPPFVRALEELRETGAGLSEAGAVGSERLGWTELPGSTEVYNASLGHWEPWTGGVHRVPVLGSGGRLAAVTTSSRNVASAFRLLAWLASAETSSQIAQVGQRPMPCRRSQAASPAWYDPALPRSERNQLAEVLQTALSRDDCFIVPRIPGIDEYLAALDRAVQDAVSGRAEPEAALRQAYADWERITDRLGREKQRRAYRGHLNLSY